MAVALDEARAAAHRGEVPVGAVVVLEEQVIGEGWNRPIAASDPTAHAEVVVLREAARKIGNYRLPGTTMVVTVEPCMMCAGALINARVARVVYGTREPKWGAFESLLQLEHLGLNHRIEVIPGVREQECSELMRSFFRTRRE